MNEITEWLQQPPALPNNAIRQAAEARQAMLTKPIGALGQLEQIVVRLASLQGSHQPCVDNVYISVFAADHGVATEGISAFPQSVTAGMLKNFSQGGAAINVLARQLDAKLEVVNLGTVNDPGSLQGVLNLQLGLGTANFCQQPAMNEQQLSRALNAGRQAVERAGSESAQLFIGGEMGIGNTTVASALACALLDVPPSLLAGPGTGLDTQGVKHKIEIITQALARHNPIHHDPLEVLRRLGGFEIAALSGSYIACAHQGLAVLVDGFISSVAALIAARLCPDAEHWFLFSHTSAEPGHRIILEALNARPLLDLGLRLGEGSGAAVAVPLLRFACALHNEMATFAEADLSGQDR